jgi:hypothetical protein
MAARRFSLEEAEALLPRLTPILSRLRELKLERDRLQLEMAQLEATVKSNGRPPAGGLKEARSGVEQTAREMRGLIEEIGQMGCELKDTELGLVDFRWERDGREVYLCWKLGEDSIRWWHDLQAGYASRQPL